MQTDPSQELHRLQEPTPKLRKMDFIECVAHKKNPNENGPGRLFKLGNAKEKGREAGIRILTALSLPAS